MWVCEAGLSASREEDAESVVFFENSHPKATPGTHRGLTVSSIRDPQPWAGPGCWRPAARSDREIGAGMR